MCTLVLRLAPGETWPLLVGANRDEMIARSFDPPAAHWPDQPDVIGGRDRLAGGTWLAVNAAGVMAGVLNRPDSLGPEKGKRSRGVLPLRALRFGSAAEAAASFRGGEAGSWRSFNLVVADRHVAFFIRGEGAGSIAAHALPPIGVHIVTAHDPNDERSARIARHGPRFRDAPAPVPPDLVSWERLLADDSPPRASAIAVRPLGGFGTTSSALIGVGPETVFRFTAGFPGEMPYADVALRSHIS